MSLPAPFDRFKGDVKPEWIDPNGHMNLAYYIVLFNQAFDVILVEWDLDWAKESHSVRAVVSEFDRAGK